MRNLRAQRGETIVEVLISVMILGFTLSAVFVIASKSLSTGQASNERTQALSIVESQIERLRYMADANKTEIYNTTPYCVKMDSTTLSTPNDPLCYGSFPDSGLKLQVVYSPNGPTASVYDDNTFTVTADWTRVGGGSGTGAETLTLVYRLPERSNIIPIPPTLPFIAATCNMTASNIGGTNYRLTYDIYDATSASISSLGVVSPAVSGTRDLLNLAPGSTNNYNLAVSSPAGGMSCPVTIVVPPDPPTPPSCTVFDAVTNNNNSVTLTWEFSTNTDTVSSNFVGGPTSALNGSATTAVLAPSPPTYVFTITVTNGWGSVNCTRTVNIISTAVCPAKATTIDVAQYTNGLIYGVNLNGTTDHGDLTFDPWFRPSGGGRVDVVPDMRVDFSLDAGCKYKLSYRAYCRGPETTLPFKPYVKQCHNPMTYDQPAERARLIFTSSRTSDDTRTLTCDGDVLAYFDAKDGTRGPSGEPNYYDWWEEEITSAAFALGDVKCINFVHVCSPSLVPPPLLNPGDCSVDGSVYYHLLTITQTL